jgi:hypothetical protein
MARGGEHVGSFVRRSKGTAGGREDGEGAVFNKCQYAGAYKQPPADVQSRSLTGGRRDHDDLGLLFVSPGPSLWRACGVGASLDRGGGNKLFHVTLLQRQPPIPKVAMAVATAPTRHPPSPTTPPPVIAPQSTFHRFNSQRFRLSTSAAFPRVALPLRVAASIPLSFSGRIQRGPSVSRDFYPSLRLRPWLTTRA